jgi:hypothetical protein
MGVHLCMKISYRIVLRFNECSAEQTKVSKYPKKKCRGSPYYYKHITVPKIWHISVGKEEEVPCRENFQ